ncbi:hypothetical protein EB796_016325 [Bugula neritina]|uniref:Uncharacterized protein n=1 Tax=Bugula neritina TaxID=10212 RepID=A0A7J7JIB4_BUGNE|nr:hypothetical protein EB796_016325 [Bugula neritina]
MDLLLTAVYVIAALTTTGLSQETYVIPFVERSSLGQTFRVSYKIVLYQVISIYICFQVSTCVKCYAIIYYTMKCNLMLSCLVSIWQPLVTLNAANSAQISIDAATDVSECGVAINLTGNMQCLEEYDLYISRSLRIPDEYDVYECRNPYQIIYDCGEGQNSTAVNDSLTLVTSDLQSLIDFNFSTVWAYRMTDSPVTITLELPEAFQMNIIIMAVETVPIDAEFYVSLGGGDETLLGRLLAVETSSCKITDNCFFYDTRPMHILGHHTYDLVTMDKLRVVFSGTNLLSYTISHLVIRELYISAA